MKALRIAVIVPLIAILCASPVSAIDVTISGTALDMPAPPVNIDGRVLVPMRGIFETLGATVDWNQADYSVTASSDAKAVRLKIGSDTMDAGIINSDGAAVFSSKRTLDAPARLVGDRTFVPIRAVSEALGCAVSWDGETETVTITPDDKSDDEYKFFYASADDYGKIYSVNADGTNRKRLTDTSASELYRADGRLYYIGCDGRFYACADDGSGETRLTDFETRFVGFYGDKAYCMRKSDNMLFEIGSETRSICETKNAVINGGYVYFNRSGDNAMIVMSLDDGTVNRAEMDSRIMLTPQNCTFYGDYVLLEDGSRYHNIYRFNADGTGKTYINNDNSRICKNQSAVENVLYINNDDGQNIYYVNINGASAGRGLAARLDDTVVYADVIAQAGDMIYYKNMYRKEIYGKTLGAEDGVYIGYGDGLVVGDGKLFIDCDGVYVSDLDGGNQYRICTRALNDMRVMGACVYGVDREYGNIVGADCAGTVTCVTNDKVLAVVSSK